MAGISRDGRIRVFAVLITFSGVPPGRGRCGNFPPHTHKVVGRGWATLATRAAVLAPNFSQ